MPEPQTRFDNERLDARLAHVTQSLSDSAHDAEHLRRLATVGTVAGLIAHEFRNLMTPVRSYAQLALRRADDPDLTRKALQTAVEGAEQAVAIAESLMDLIGMAPSEAGGSAASHPPAGESRWCHVEHAVRSALTGFETELAEAGLTVELDLEPELRASIAEPDLRQVLLNLIQNAVRACGLVEGAGELTISARSVNAAEWSLSADLEDGGVNGDSGEACSWHIEGGSPGGLARGPERVLIEVCDRGCGILADSIARVFEPFVSEAGGRGMGLATCRALVVKAGGRLGVSSGRGVGTRFVLELDRAL